MRKLQSKDIVKNCLGILEKNTFKYNCNFFQFYTYALRIVSIVAISFFTPSCYKLLFVNVLFAINSHVNISLNFYSLCPDWPKYSRRRRDLMFTFCQLDDKLGSCCPEQEAGCKVLNIQSWVPRNLRTCNNVFHA